MPERLPTMKPLGAQNSAPRIQPAQPDTTDHRLSPSRRGYDTRWRRARAWHLRRNPLCELCGKAATDVHHKRGIREGGNHAAENLQALCHVCHSTIT
ncbi:MAG: HNH endonuclease, partial [Candidatus Atribacteria bacterium]|nr:HNH endonuclease [Candidatus Atribacteria bacterium]